MADLGTLDILGYCGTALLIAVQQLLRASVRVAPLAIPRMDGGGWRSSSERFFVVLAKKENVY